MTSAPPGPTRTAGRDHADPNTFVPNSSTASTATATNISGPRVALHTRPATPADLPSLPAIFNHYIVHSVISFRLNPVNADFYENVYTDTTCRGLPFLVATTSSPPLLGSDFGEHTDGNIGESEPTEGEERVIGYAYALPFRPAYTAYRHTVEISIYIHHQYHSVGVGSVLMDVLMSALRTTCVPDPTQGVDTTSGEADVERPDGTGRIRQVLSVMSLDTEGRDGGQGLERFYGRWGFGRVGCMKSVGFKFGRWIDVLILQVTL